MGRWFDAHLDLAYLAACGRDIAAPLNPLAGPHPPAAVTLDSMREAGVAGCLATVFIEPHPSPFAGGATDEHPFIEGVSYRAGDAESAHTAGAAQLSTYAQLASRGLIRLNTSQGRLQRQTGGAGRAPWVGVLIEGADPIRSPSELTWWAQRGVVAVALAWWTASRYAGGNGTDEGLTPMGRELIAEIDRLGLVHDLSHLSQRSCDELLSLTDRPVIASHSNCRALLDGKTQRHLADPAIREVARRGGVIGVVLHSAFIDSACDKEGRASVARLCDHIDRIADLHGHARAVGLGSDIDGGFSADRLPSGINSHGDLRLITDELSRRNHKDADIEAFAYGNWARFWGLDGETSDPRPGAVKAS